MFSTLAKGQDKNLNMFRTKRTFKMKLKTFLITFKGLSLKQIKNLFFLENKSPTLSIKFRLIFSLLNQIVLKRIIHVYQIIPRDKYFTDTGKTQCYVSKH